MLQYGKKEGMSREASFFPILLSLSRTPRPETVFERGRVSDVPPEAGRYMFNANITAGTAVPATLWYCFGVLIILWLGGRRGRSLFGCTAINLSCNVATAAAVVLLLVRRPASQEGGKARQGRCTDIETRTMPWESDRWPDCNFYRCSCC